VLGVDIDVDALHGGDAKGFLGVLSSPYRELTQRAELW
jgi:hypothetical protein